MKVGPGREEGGEAETASTRDKEEQTESMGNKLTAHQVRPHSPESSGHMTEGSASSLSPSQLDRAILEMLNLDAHSPSGNAICNVNPISKNGKRIQVMRLLGTVLVPILSLLMLIFYILILQVQGYRETLDIQSSVRFSLDISDFVYFLQRERDLSALYVSAIGPETKNQLLKVYVNTDNALSDLNGWIAINIDGRYLPSKDRFYNYLNAHRYNLDISAPTPQGELAFYSQIIDNLFSKFYEVITEAKSGSIWKDLVAMQELQAARDALGIERAMGAIFFARGGFSDLDEYIRFTEGYDQGNDGVQAARQFSVQLDLLYNQTLLDLRQELDDFRDMRLQVKHAILDKVNQSMEKADVYFNGLTMHMNVYRDMQRALVAIIEVKLGDNVKIENQTLAMLGAVFGLVILMFPLIINGVYRLTSDMQGYSMKLVDRTKALNKEKKRTDRLLYRMLPKTVAERLKNNEVVTAESYSEVTIFFSDIVGFTTISARSSPIQVVNMLNDLYTCFDSRIETYDVYKVETIGDAYMVASGVPHSNGHQHVLAISNLALDLMDEVDTLPIPHMPGKHFRMRIGINTGPLVAGVVGVKMPRYCLFGKAVSFASFLESHGEAGKIHISASTQNLLHSIGGYIIKERSTTFKDLNGSSTYWLVDKVGRDKLPLKRSSSGSLSPLYADQASYQDRYNSGGGYESKEEEEEDLDVNLFIHRRISTQDESV